MSGQAASWPLQVSLQQAKSNRSQFQIEDIAYPRNMCFCIIILGPHFLNILQNIFYLIWFLLGCQTQNQIEVRL